jgi:hypothetical protein
MANKKIFTNTYITGSGRQNYLRVDHLEDPLFTSFTFDIDFVSSPLFYTIKNYIYPHPDEKSISDQIETALKDMYGKHIKIDEGYDILPLLSAEFLNGNKLGFGLQQNIYTDLPLYGATEYIHMVDKKNSNGRSQNDVRYNSSDDFVDGTGNQNAYKSYKLGDSVKEAVSESDITWVEKQIDQAKAQKAECEKIMADKNVKSEYDELQSNMNVSASACNEVKKTVDGESLNESELQQKVNEYKQLENSFEQLKRDICSWANRELSSIRNQAVSIYMENNCVKKIMSYDTTKPEYTEELKKTYGESFSTEYIWDFLKVDNNSYLSKSLKLYNKYVTYVYGTFKTGAEMVHCRANDGESFLVWTNDAGLCIRSSKVKDRFNEKLTELGIDTFSIQIRPLAESPEWAVGIDDRLDYFANGTQVLTEKIVVDLLKFQCDVEDSFNNFGSKKVEENQTILAKYESALDDIKTELYGFEDGQPRDISNPTSYSKYGEYLATKEKYDNCAYLQAERSLAIAESGIAEMTSMLPPEHQQTISDENSNEPVPVNNQQAKETPNNIVTPRTVLDMLGFISGMRKMTTEYPYIIQGITGLDKAYENHYGVKDPFMGSGDNKITLTCWESLDLRVSSMFNRYFNAVYDRQYRRERVPVNLRRFNCSVYVHDIRNFVSKSRSEYVNRVIELTDMYHSVIEFRFYDCEIVPEETGNIFDNISNEAPSEMKKTNFTFTYGNCVVNFVPQS